MEKPSTEHGGREPSSSRGGVSRATRLRGDKVSGRRPPVTMEAKTDLDISRKPARVPSQFSTDGCSIDFGTFDKHGFIYIPPCIGEQCQSAPDTGDCAAATQASSLQESDSSDKIAPPGEGKVQKTPITKDPGESVGDVIVDKLTKRELDVDSPEIITGGFCRAKLMDNLRCLAKSNKMSNEMRKKRKTSGEQAI